MNISARNSKLNISARNFFWIFLHEKKLGRIAQHSLSKNIHIWAQGTREGQASREPREDKQLGTQGEHKLMFTAWQPRKDWANKYTKNFHFQILLEVIWPKNEC